MFMFAVVLSIFVFVCVCLRACFYDSLIACVRAVDCFRVVFYIWFAV